MQDRECYIAVIAPSHLVGLGLKVLIEDLVPYSEAVLYEDAQTFIADVRCGRYRFVHCFAYSGALFEYPEFFGSLPFVTIALVNGDLEGKALSKSKYPCMDISGGRSSVMSSFLSVHGSRHGKSHSPSLQAKGILSEREACVLRLLAKGLTNKEIAASMGIGVTTVITHRKNITDKLGIKSLPALTIYAVLNGHIGIEQI